MLSQHLMNLLNNADSVVIVSDNAKSCQEGSLTAMAASRKRREASSSSRAVTKKPKSRWESIPKTSTTDHAPVLKCRRDTSPPKKPCRSEKQYSLKDVMNKPQRRVSGGSTIFKFACLPNAESMYNDNSTRNTAEMITDLLHQLNMAEDIVYEC